MFIFKFFVCFVWVGFVSFHGTDFDISPLQVSLAWSAMEA